MKKYLLAAVAALAPAAHANAAYANADTINCSAATVDVGNPGRDSVVSTSVVHDNAGWVVQHTLASGIVINRNNQYAMADYSSASVTQWHGTLNRNPSMRMIGEIKRVIATGRPVYEESLYQDGQLIMHSLSYCEGSYWGNQRAPTQVAQQPTMRTPPPAPINTYAPPPVDDSVVMLTAGGESFVSVGFGSQTATMLLDTGANLMSIPQSLANALLASGDAVYDTGGDYTVTQANGATVTEKGLVISQVKIGSHVLNNVPASIVPDGAKPLLSLPVLNRIGRFTIDSANNKLIFS